MANVYKLVAEPPNSLGKDSDLAVSGRFLYFKNDGIWIRVAGDLGKFRNTYKNQIAIWEGQIKVKGSDDLQFSEKTGLTIKKIDEATSDTDKFLVSDDGVLKYRTGEEVASDIGESILTTGALNSGSITSGFGNINVGSSTIDTTGNVSVGDLTVSGGDIIGGTDTTLQLAADLNVDVKLDNDNDGTQFFRVINGGGSVASSIDESGNLVCTEITSGAVVWHEWIFNVFRGVANRYYYRDQADADDFRKWDSYSTLDGSGDIVIATQFVSGHFVVPENCTLKVMHGQVYNNGSTVCPTISVFSGTPSNSSSLTASLRGATQPNSGSALTSNQNYTFSKTDFDYDLAAGDIVLPTVHYGSGSLQSYIGCLTLKFVTR